MRDTKINKPARNKKLPIKTKTVGYPKLKKNKEIETNIKKRNALRRLYKKQENYIALIEQKAKLSFELCDLNNELWRIVQKRA